MRKHGLRAAERRAFVEYTVTLSRAVARAIRREDVYEAVPRRRDVDIHPAHRCILRYNPLLEFWGLE